jgi:putative oxygen-independent coproporphyrinogen III oxidase
MAAHETAAQAMHWLRPGGLHLTALPPLSLYIHLPWCLKKCPYCDFNSHEWGASRGEEGAMPWRAYLDALRADLESSLPLIWGRTVHSVFIGGGTPSLFPPEAIDTLLGDVRRLVRLEAAAEITLEANPGTFEKDRFRGFREAGVTRLSVGVQSFDDAHLQALGRVHSGAQARAALQEVATHFSTFNLDLMYALPGQTLDGLARDLETALSFAPPHLSVYHLTLEPNTWFAKHPPVLPDEDTAWDMLDHLTQRLAEAGLVRYEVSAYARPGHRCWHNTHYWQFGDYLGIGAGAHGKLSFAHRVLRQVRWREPRRYMEQALAGQPCASETEVAVADLPFEFMLNALRLREGFAPTLFSERTGLPIHLILPTLQAAVDRGWLQWQGAHVQPTERGFDLLSDLQALFLP